MSHQMNSKFPLGRKYQGTTVSIGLVYLMDCEYIKFVIENAKFFVNDINYIKNVKLISQLPFDMLMAFTEGGIEVVDSYFAAFKGYGFDDLKYTGVISADFTDEELQINTQNYNTIFHSDTYRYEDIALSEQLHFVHFLSNEYVEILWQSNSYNKRLNAKFSNYRLSSFRQPTLVLNVDNTEGIMTTYPHINDCKIVFEDFTHLFLKNKFPNLSNEDLLEVLKKYFITKTWQVYIEDERIVCKIVQNNTTLKKPKDIPKDIFDTLEEEVRNIPNNGFIMPYNLDGHKYVTIAVDKNKVAKSYNPSKDQYIGVLDNGSYTILNWHDVKQILEDKFNSKETQNSHPLLMGTGLNVIKGVLEFIEGTGTRGF